MTKKIHTIQSSDKVEFDKQVNQFLELGRELMDGGYQVKRIVFKNNCEVEFYEDGQLKCVKNKNEDGEWDGLHYGWYNNGEKMYERTYKDGKQDGVETWWDKYENGQKRYEGTYKNGEMISTKIWDEDGKQTFGLGTKDESDELMSFRDLFPLE